MELHLRHRTAAAGLLVNLWDLDSDDRVIASIRVAGTPVVHVVITVRNLAVRNRRCCEFACWPVGRAGEWRIEHGVFDAYLEPPHPLLPAMGLLLSGAPSEVSRRLSIITG